MGAQKMRTPHVHVRRSPAAVRASQQHPARVADAGILAVQVRNNSSKAALSGSMN